MNYSKIKGIKPTREVYHSLIETAFSDSKVLVAGILSSLGAIILTAVTSGSLVIWVLAGIFALVGSLRLYLGHSFHKLRESGDLRTDHYSVWENKFTFFATLHVFTFGLWCFAAAYIDDPFSRQVSITVTFANLIGICGRSYPLSRLVNLQLFAATIPIVAGLIYSSGNYTILAFFIVPYMFGIQKIAAYQRRVLFENIFQRQKAQSLATQFHTALNNVPQGICMFDSAGRLEVVNEHISIFTGRTQRSLKGSSIRELIELMRADLKLSDGCADEIMKWVFDSEQGSVAPFDLQVELTLGEVKFIRFRASQMQNGGAICTFDDVTAEVKAASTIDHLERFDRLTGLMRRNRVSKYIDQLWPKCDDDHDVAVILLNIDGFKKVNDDQGHRFGDALLQNVSKRLTKCVGILGTCARFGGDEFAIVISGTDCLDVTSTLADGIVEAMTEPFSIEGRKIKIDCSVGIALSSEEECGSVDSLITNADLARLAAKKDGNGFWRIFDASMNRELRQRRVLEADLSLALSKGQLEVVFQPLVSVDQKIVASCEALMRWKHPEHGYIPPYKFIPIAEQLGLVVDMGAWILEEACKNCASWPNKTHVAVNLSPIQFTHGDIVASVRHALQISGLDPSRLELEITESLMLDDMKATIDTLNKFKEMGVRISLDDFGTGYSSLSYMNNLPLDKVKIDRSFILGLKEGSKSLTLINAIVALGHQLGLKVVVEGVETADELAILLRNSAPDEIQGYLFSKPVSAVDALKLVTPRYKANKEMLEILQTISQKAA